MPPRKNNNNDKKSDYCLFCKIKGHKDSECYKKKRQQGKSSSGGEDKKEICLLCGKQGHWAQDCSLFKDCEDVKDAKVQVNYTCF